MLDVYKFRCICLSTLILRTDTGSHGIKIWGFSWTWTQRLNVLFNHYYPSCWKKTDPVSFEAVALGRCSDINPHPWHIQDALLSMLPILTHILNNTSTHTWMKGFMKKNIHQTITPVLTFMLLLPLPAFVLSGGGLIMIESLT